jgi:hypothetical protein
VDVWWDARDQELDLDQIRRERDSARCVVVLWSKASIRLGVVGIDPDRVVQAILEDVQPPEFYGDRRYANLIGWEGDTGAQGFLQLMELIGQHVQPTLFPRRKVDANSIPRGAAATEFPTSVDADSAHGGLPTADPAPPRRVFLCYRRQDTQGHTGRLRDRLVSVYGKDAVFMDVDDVPHGIDFVEYIEGVLTGCAVMVVMIGQSWATIADRKGRRRLDQPNDLLRGEIAAALRGKIPVIPVLVEDASMPDAEDVPEDIQGLTRRTTVELTHRRWEADVQQVVKVIEKFMEAAKAGS